MTIARAHAAEEGVGDLGWVVDMQERYFSLASEDIRRSAARRADAWMAKHEPMRSLRRRHSALRPCGKNDL
ncbi:hypothetical protein V6L77_24695 [Pannonibacter sp. Pt2-lr]